MNDRATKVGGSASRRVGGSAGRREEHDFVPAEPRTRRPADWLRHTDAVDGVELLEAWFQGRAYRKHRHDTYAICLTESGVQTFDYRGASHLSLPGDVVVLHPDELHDGNAGAESGFGYRQIYVEPERIFEAVRVLCGPAAALPFVRDPVLTSPKLATAVQTAFRDGREPLVTDDIVLQITEGLVDADPSSRRPSPARRLDFAALDRARAFLDAEKTRLVHSSELEALTGLTRFDLARQFRARFGTSPYRYLLMRRLDIARTQIAQGRTIVEVALETGFADQSHFTRMFVDAYGLPPARYAALRNQTAHPT